MHFEYIQSSLFVSEHSACCVCFESEGEAAWGYEVEVLFLMSCQLPVLKRK